MDYALVAIVGSLGGFLAVFGGGFITIPSLILLGLPAQTAVGTSKFAGLAFWLSLLARFGREKNVIRWDMVVPLTAVGVVGSVMGALIIVNTPEDIVTLCVAFSVLLALPLMLKKDAGLVTFTPSPARKATGYVVYFFIAIYSGFLGAGSGMLTSAAYARLFGMTLTQGRATDALPRFLMSLAAIGIYLKSGLVRFDYALMLMAGFAAGGWAGAHLSLKKGDVWVKRVFIVIAVVLVIKLLLENL